MIMRTMHALLTLGLNVLVLAQPAIDWQRTYGGSGPDLGYAFDPTNDGGYILVGTSNSSDGDVTGLHGLNDIWAVKLAADGSIDWQRCLGGSQPENGYAVRQCTDGGFILTGVSNSNDGDLPQGVNGQQDIWVVKLTSMGELEWQRTYGGSAIETGHAIAELPEGGFVVVARTASTDGPMADSHGDLDIWVGWLAPDGELLRSKCFGGSSAEVPSAVSVLPNGDLLISGHSSSLDGDVVGVHEGDEINYPDVWVFRIDATGEILWQLCAGGTGLDLARCHVVAADGSIYVGAAARSVDGDLSSPRGGMDFWVLHINPTGELIAEASFGGASDEQPYGIALRSDGHVVVGGVSISDDGDITAALGGTDAWLCELDADLQLVWQKNYGGSSGDHCRAICFEPDNEMTFFGYSSSTDGDLVGSVGGTNFWLVNFEPFGVGLFEQNAASPMAVYPSPATNTLQVVLPNTQHGTLEVLDLSGRVLVQQTVRAGSTQAVVDVEELAAGVYSVRFAGAVGIGLGRFVKE